MNNNVTVTIRTKDGSTLDFNCESYTQVTTDGKFVTVEDEKGRPRMEFPIKRIALISYRYRDPMQAGTDR